MTLFSSLFNINKLTHKSDFILAKWSVQPEVCNNNKICDKRDAFELDLLSETIVFIESVHNARQRD